MKHWSLAKRIVCGFAAILLLFGLVGVIAYLPLKQSRGQLGTIVANSLPGVYAAAEIRSNAAENQLCILRHILAESLDEKKKIEEEIDANRAANQKVLAEYEKTLTHPEDREQYARLTEARQQYVQMRKGVLALSREGKTKEAIAKNSTELRKAYVTYRQLCDDLYKMNQSEAQLLTVGCERGFSRANKIFAASNVLTILAGVLIAYWIIRGLKRVLNHVAQGINDGSHQVAIASSQVATASQALAEGASEQAAALEETSAALEQITTTVRRNADSASKAKDISSQTRVAADSGANDVRQMQTAMAAIESSSAEVAKIVKSIDEIAFQTNILALNAAVEAARAGEAGAGFAVVADEVRNLAQRSAKAAKETAEKIEDAIRKTGQGVQVSAKVAESLTQILDKARQVDVLVAEIASASGEQSQGIEQVTTAVIQVDRVTQSNAASSEQSASAAEELSAQAETQKVIIRELMELLGTKASPKAAQAPAEATPATSHSNSRNHGGKSPGSGPSLGSRNAQDIQNRSAIPLEDCFKDN